MEALRGMRLPPGFGFHPSDAELISHYLKKKVHGQRIEHNPIPEVDIYKHEPWDLPSKCNLPIEDNKWHFFASRDRKYPAGARSNRATRAGYWKSTGKDRTIKLNKRTLGTKKTLVFHKGRPPSGKRTEWIMHEYYIDENECQASPDMKDAFVLCRVTRRDDWALENDNGVGNRNPCSQQLNDAATSVVIAEKQDAAVSGICSGEPNHVATPASAEPSNDFATTDFIAHSPNIDSEMEAILNYLMADLPSIPAMDTCADDLSLTEQNDVSSNLQNPSSMAPKIEPDHASPIQNGIDETDGLTYEEFLSILPGIDGSGDTFSAYMGLDHGTTPYNFQGTNEELQFFEEYNANMPNENSHNGITVRSRNVTAPSASSSPSNRRIRLQVGVNRMVTSNSETINQTIEFAGNSGRMRSFRQSDATKSSENHCNENQGYSKGIKNAFRSTTRFNVLFACICMIGVIAAMLHGYYSSGISS